MERVINLLFLLLVCAISMAQSQRDHLSFSLSQHDFCDTIPIEFENDQVYIPVIMNGERHRFNLDTGSSQGAIYKGTHIGYWTELGNVVSNDANGRRDTVRVIALPPFQMGHLVVSHYVASVFNRPPVNTSYDAIIGFDLFNKGICAKIDTREKMIVLTDRRGMFDEERGYPLPYRLRWFVPYVMVSPFIRHVDEALFDLGSRPLYVLNKQSFDEHAYKSKNVTSQVEGKAIGHLAIGTFGTEDVDEVAFLHLNRFKWDDVCFTHYRTVTTQGGSRVGAQILRYGSIIIDPFKKQIIYQPYNGTDTIEMNNKQMGVAFVPQDGHASVGLIFEKSNAYLQGMREGDVVLKINDTPIYSFEAFQRFPFVEGETYRFLLRDRNGKEKAVTTTR